MNHSTFTATPDLIAAFEQRYRNAEREHALLLDSFGSVVVERGGDESEVKFSLQQLERACMGSLTHNHPHAMPPSGEDLALAAKYGLMLRAVGQTREGEQIDYTVRMNAPSQQTADAIMRGFGIETKRAEGELVNRRWGDEQWYRESRHLAVERLAEQFGFSYQRHIHQAPVSEMGRNQDDQRLNLFAEAEQVMTQDVFRPAFAQIAQVITRNADQSGYVPVRQLEYVRQEVSRIVTHMMLGKPTQHGALAPYSIHNGKVIPDSPYFSALWKLIQRAAELAISYHADMMRKYLPADIQRLFEMAKVNPFEAPVSVHEMDDTPTPLIYDPLRRWADGKTLSDRIWSAAGDMRRKLDEYLAGAIGRGVPAAQMARDLESFLLQGKGSYEARRLARTELAAAYSHADSAAAQMNPFVETYTPMTVPTHQCCDQCDVEQQNGPYPKADTSHLSPFHPECLCKIVWHTVKNVQAVIAYLRQQIERGLSGATQSIVDLLNPLAQNFNSMIFRGLL